MLTPMHDHVFDGAAMETEAPGLMGEKATLSEARTVKTNERLVTSQNRASGKT